MSFKEATVGNPFADVTPTGRRAPSWIAKHAAPARTDVQSLRPAPLPREFVSAVHDELERSTTQIEERAAARRSAPPPAMKQGRDIRRAEQGPELDPSRPRSETARSHGSVPAAEGSSPFAAHLIQQQADATAREAREAVQQALADLANARSVIYETAANQLAELAATIARRVIAHELTVNPDIVRQLVEEGMHALEHQDRLVVRIGRGFEGLEESLAQQLGPESEHVEVFFDDALSDYGCTVETEHGWVDESIETRLATLLQELRADSDSP